jgi:putative MATE family efflux protein
MVFISFYTSIDSIFISRFVGSNALAAVNIALPLYSVAFACGIMFATGGGAIIAIKLGQNKLDEASKNFTSLLIIGILFGILATIICLLFEETLITALGASKNIKTHALAYSFYLILSFPFLIIKVVFESILRVDGKPNTALFMTLLGGILNIIFDYIFMVPMHMGIAGAGLGTFLGIVLSNLVGFYHFTSNKSLLKFKTAKPDFKFILSTITNGSSEMVNEFSIALTTFIFNMLTMKYMGDNGVAAITIILGLNFLIISVFIGFSTGVAPLISYNYGRGNEKNIRTIIRFSKNFILIGSVLLFIISMSITNQLVNIYTDKSNAVYPIAVAGLQSFSISFLFVGINIFGSAFFTAFENGKISALISFVKSFVFFIIAAWILPSLFKVEGIWLITPVSEFCSMFMVLLFMLKYQKVYKYNLIGKLARLR